MSPAVSWFFVGGVLLGIGLLVGFGPRIARALADARFQRRYARLDEPGCPNCGSVYGRFIRFGGDVVKHWDCGYDVSEEG